MTPGKIAVRSEHNIQIVGGEAGGWAKEGSWVRLCSGGLKR